jgi:hypothetical protein
MEVVEEELREGYVEGRRDGLMERGRGRRINGGERRMD